MPHAAFALTAPLTQQNNHQNVDKCKKEKKKKKKKNKKKKMMKKEQRDVMVGANAWENAAPATVPQKHFLAC